MSETKGKYRNYEKTEIAIKDALEKLCLEKNSLDKITVKELCDLAKISKSTFYLHYPNIDQIFQSVAQSFVVTFSTVVKKISTVDNPNIAFFIQSLLININESNRLITIALKYGRANSEYINTIKSFLETMILSSSVYQQSKIEKNQLIVEAKLISAGITDYAITLLRENSMIPLKEIANSIHVFTNRWNASLLL